MSVDASQARSSPCLPAATHWKEIVACFQTPSAWKASWQLLNSLGSYLAVWVLIYFCAQISYWLTLPLVILGGGLLVRIFIIFHDCGHGSFLRSRKANDFWGFIAGALTFTPYYHWRWEHSLHHATAGDLDRRGGGDVWTMTVEEYLNASRWRRFCYRVVRNPLILFVLGPLALFLVAERFPSARAGKRERHSVWWTNATLLLLGTVMSLIFGLLPYLVLQLSIMAIAGSVGVWMFYVQHQYEDVYWERSERWDYVRAALEGSSFYKLPRVLQWFSGNIGFHHIHHLSPRIPNYNLQRCHESDPLFRSVRPLTMVKSLKSLSLRLWDEQRRKLVGFRALRALRKG